MAKKPFHTSILDTIKQTGPSDVMSFVTLCKLIVSTKMSEGHAEVESALETLAVHGGHQYVDEFLNAVRALQLEAEAVAKARRQIYHDSYELDDGTPVGVMGAMHYILGEDGKPLNDGFHRYIHLKDGTLVGKLGASMQILRDGQPISDRFHNIEPTDYGYLASVESKMVKLDKDGQLL